MQLWYASASFCPVGINIAREKLRRSAEMLAGAYIILTDTDWRAVNPPTFDDHATNGKVAYIGGCSRSTPSRAQTALRSTTLASYPPHRFGENHRRFFEPGRSPDPSALLLVTFSSSFSIEKLLMDRHVALTGRLPPANLRRPTLPGTTVRQKLVDLTWDAFLAASEAA